MKWWRDEVNGNIIIKWNREMQSNNQVTLFSQY